MQSGSDYHHSILRISVAVKHKSEFRVDKYSIMLNYHNVIQNAHDVIRNLTEHSGRKWTFWKSFKGNVFTDS